jgi:hypothetical protein
MKNIYFVKRFGAVAVLLLMAVGVFAQSALRTGYFLQGNPYRYRLNAALMNDQNYIALPVLGNIGINAAGNVGLANFVYDAPNGRDLVTFMHPSVDADDFLGDIDSDNQIRANIDLVVLSGGFFAFGGYNTIDVGVHSRTSMNLPYDMFRFMKTMGAGEYSLSDLNINTRNYLDFALGHSRKITEELTVGARLKFLFGVAYADVMFDRMDISMNGQQWRINAMGSANIALGGHYTYSDEKSINGKTAVDGYDDVTPGLNGFGMGIDLGATYDLSDVLTEGLTLSAALNDLGFMNWKKVAKAGISPENPYMFNGFDNISIHDDVPGANIEDQFESLQDDLEDFFTLEDKGEGSESCGLGATLNLGAEYKMPFYNKLSAGILYTHGFEDIYSYNQVSLMLNWAPVKSFDVAVSGTSSTYGTGFGAMANVHLTGFNFFVGTDCFLSKVGKQFIPLENMNASVAFGINIPFGAKR